ncbi:MAG: hypothetical protein JWM11_5388 [Planctomycetaceae bacterium]|nr:hypothetical protein [Planctomycetaceae bacterium]
MRLHVCLCFGLLLGAIGCSGSGSIALPDTVAATGMVTLDGKPIQFAMVTFVPRTGTKGIECTGVTDETGDFDLKQIRGKDGVPPGEYTVVINRYVKADGTPVALDGSEPPANLGAVESLPSCYSNPGESKLTAKVTEEGGTFRFDLNSL